MAARAVDGASICAAPAAANQMRPSEKPRGFSLPLIVSRFIFPRVGGNIS